MSTGTIAPHEGNELGLAMAGIKPLAVIEARKQPQQYALAMIHAQSAVNSDQPWHGPDVHYYFYSGTEGPEVWIALNMGVLVDYEALINQRSGAPKTGTPDYHRAMGKLFGYSHDDIEAFINDRPDCTCGKCGDVPENTDDGTAIVLDFEAGVRYITPTKLQGDVVKRRTMNMHGR